MHRNEYCQTRFEKGKVREPKLPNFNTYFKAAVIKTVWPMSTYVVSLNFNKCSKIKHW